MNRPYIEQQFIRKDFFLWLRGKADEQMNQFSKGVKSPFALTLFSGSLFSYEQTITNRIQERLVSHHEPGSSQ
jgi:hypothetical protein